MCLPDGCSVEVGRRPGRSTVHRRGRRLCSLSAPFADHFCVAGGDLFDRRDADVATDPPTVSPCAARAVALADVPTWVSLGIRVSTSTRRSSSSAWTRRLARQRDLQRLDVHGGVAAAGCCHALRRRRAARARPGAMAERLSSGCDRGRRRARSRGRARQVGHGVTDELSKRQRDLEGTFRRTRAARPGQRRRRRRRGPAAGDMARSRSIVGVGVRPDARADNAGADDAGRRSDAQPDARPTPKPTRAPTSIACTSRSAATRPLRLRRGLPPAGVGAACAAAADC